MRNKTAELAVKAFLDRRAFLRYDVSTYQGNNDIFFLAAKRQPIAALDRNNRLYVEAMSSPMHKQTLFLYNLIPGVQFTKTEFGLFYLNGKRWHGYWTPVMEWTFGFDINYQETRVIEYNHLHNETTIKRND